ncbi:alpha/beta fold hydrolase [Glacieibacterium sp.]|uniref:alpha/beta fold hydrolase n=1 Tax=Glacieibacterium sp. TaxID=2860237 RepID=UPI003B00E340
MAAARLILLALLAAAAPAAAPWEAPQQLVKLADGRRLNLYCTGQGSPTVIFESGFGGTIWTWARTQPLVAATNRACAYDRAGLGFSDPGPMPRDGAATAADLAQLLAAARIAPPYVLVGHSAGAMSMRLFADAHPREVAGMVLVDPSIEGQFDGQEAAVATRVARYEVCAVAAEARGLPSTEPGLRHCDFKPIARLSAQMNANFAAERLNPSYWRTQASEYASIAGATSAELRRGRQSYGDLPLVVLTAGQSAATSPGWVAAHVALAARSTRGEQRTIAGASHNIMNDDPAAVATAIRDVSGAPRSP